jgi:hypothetical protein
MLLSDLKEPIDAPSQASATSETSRTSSNRPSLGRSSTMPSPVKASSDPFALLMSTDPQQAASSRRPVVASRSRTGVIGRMLGRSGTESSIQKGALAPSLPRTVASVPRLPLVRTDSASTLTGAPGNEQTQDASRSPSPSPTRPPLKTYAKTYGGASRSFLVTLPAHSEAASRLLQEGTGELDIETYNALTAKSQLQSELDAMDAEAHRQSYASLRAQLGVDVSSDGPHFEGEDLEAEELEDDADPSPSKLKGKAIARPAQLPPGMMNDLKSITELRSKGESRRFLDDLGYLFEGLNDTSSVGVRRGRYVPCTINLVPFLDHATVRWRSSPSCVIWTLPGKRRRWTSFTRLG